MSKREHYNEQDYIEWLKSLGCLVYAPLDSQSNIKNLINDRDIEPYRSDSMEWSSSEQMFLFKKASGQGTSDSGYFAKFPLGNTYSTPEFTALAEIKSFYNNTFTMAWDMLPTRYGVTFDTTYNKLVKTAYRFTIVSSVESAQYRFKDGVETGYYGGYSPQPMFTFDTIRIGNPNNSTNMNQRFYIRNFMFFDKSLSLDTIKQIQRI